VRELAPLACPRDAALRAWDTWPRRRRASLSTRTPRGPTIARRELDASSLPGPDRRREVAPDTGDAIGLSARTGRRRGKTIRWRHLVGADGSDSAVRRALDSVPREYFAANTTSPASGSSRCASMRPGPIASGYFWVFHMAAYTYMAPWLRAPGGARGAAPVISTAAERLGVARDGVPFEGATIEVAYHGCHSRRRAPGGDAAESSRPSGEGSTGIVTGEEVAGACSSPAPGAQDGQVAPHEAAHDRLARWLARPAPRA